MQQHIVTAFTDELDQLSANLLRMGGMAEAMIKDACKAVVKDDAELAKSVIQRDAELDKLESECERDVVRILALRQPMASDLRMVIGGIKLAGTIERIGDLAKNIARRSINLDDAPTSASLRGVKSMGKAVSRQLKTALDAYARSDARAAMEVINQDDDIDSHYNALLRLMLSFIVEEPEQIDSRANILFIVKNLERIGDHCANIAKVVHYIATGKQVLSEAEIALLASNAADVEEAEE
ncbi:MAG: phosphate signaling complex protein PhoU [Henriciella sp.]|nr:phosphate signaling complex protein PhoU [Henriciella sp.]